MTVSLALRRHGSIPAATRQRVVAEAERVGYRPNPLVSALMAQLRGAKKPRYQATLAVVHNGEQADWSGMFPAAKFMEAGVRARADELGFGLDTFWLREERWTDGRLERALRQRGIAGIVVAPLPEGKSSISFEFSGFAAAAIGLSLQEPQLACATSNYFQTVQLVHGHLVATGRKRIGLAVEPHQDERTRHQWIGAYLGCEVASGRHANMARLGPTDREAFLKWVRREKLDAVMSIAPIHAAWLGDAGKGRVAYACLTLPQSARGIAGARSNARGIGAAAVDLVVAQLNRNERGVPVEAQVLQIPAKWVDATMIPNTKVGATA